MKVKFIKDINYVRRHDQVINDNVLTKGKVYDAEETPKMYDPDTFAAFKKYQIKCDDGYYRLFHKDSFHVVEEYREQQLDNLLSDK
jgi:hypothetical protein